MEIVIVWVARPKLTVVWFPLQMAPKKRPGERWFMLALDVVWKEYETPQDESYVPKDGLVIAWSLQVVKASQFKLLFVVKVGTFDQNT